MLDIKEMVINKRRHRFNYNFCSITINVMPYQSDERFKYLMARADDLFFVFKLFTNVKV